MRVLLIHPEIRTVEPPRHPPYGLLQLAAITHSMGFDVSVLDNNAFRYPIDAVRQSIKEEKIKEGKTWDIIGVTGLTTQYKFIKQLLPVCREEFPSAVIVGGGGFLSTAPFDMMKYLKELDIGVIGEAYQTWRDIQDAVANNVADWKRIKGLVYREGSKIKLSSMRPHISEEDLDEEIPFPAYEFSPVEVYLQNSQIPYSPESLMPVANIGEPRRRLDVLASYGCNYQCYFCAHPACFAKIYGKQLEGKLFRQHTPHYVVDLMSNLRTRYAVNFASFIDENFTTNKQWFMEFCNEVENADLIGVMQWGIVGHTRTVDAEMLRRGRECGLCYISYGGETPSEHLLKDIGKGQTKEQMTAAIQATQAANINAIMSFIVGFPKTTIDDVIEQAQFFVDNRIHASPFFLQPYPGTKLYEENKDKIIEQYLTSEEKNFIHSPSVEKLKAAWNSVPNPSPMIDFAKKDMDIFVTKIKEEGLERWLLSLDDATRLSVNLTDFTDEDLIAFRYYIETWDIQRLKHYKKTHISETPSFPFPIHTSM